MLSIQNRAHGESFDVARLKDGLLVSLAALCAVLLLLLAVDKGLAHMGAAESASSKASAESSASSAAEPFDYFPAQYLNQAKDVEPQVDTF